MKKFEENPSRTKRDIIEIGHTEHDHAVEFSSTLNKTINKTMSFLLFSLSPVLRYLFTRHTSYKIIDM